MGAVAATLIPGALSAGPAGAEVVDAVEVDVTPIRSEGWRVSISHAERSNPFALLGFISPVQTSAGERFQVCVIGQPGAEIEKPTLAEAVDVLRPEPGQVEAILAGRRR